MAETVNIGAIAETLSKDIFRHFLWATHPKKDDNFPCTNGKHKSDGGKPKITHPADVVFHYRDPYLGKIIYIHTDLKSYNKESISSIKIRDALKSLCMTVDCARGSEDWREKYSVDEHQPHEVRGLLFVHNHDNQYQSSFSEMINRIDLSNLPIAPGTQLHFMGPYDIQRLYSIANDLIRLAHDEVISKKYTFYYPDLVLSRKQSDIANQAATIETLTSPYIIIKHAGTENSPPGFVIYYNAPGTSAEEFEYFLDSLSRYQMLESGTSITVRTTNTATNDLKALFNNAKRRYVRAWGFDAAREAILEKINIDRITSVTTTYNPGDFGWRE